MIRIGENCALFTGDNVEVLRREVQDNSVQLTVTSPPYDNLRKYNGFTWNFEQVARELYRVTKLGGVVVWVTADATLKGSETGTSFRQALFLRDVCGFNLHDTMIYSSDKPPLTHNRYEQKFEFMFVFSKGRPGVFNPFRDPCKYAGQNKSKQRYRQDGAELSAAHKQLPVNLDKIRGNIWFFSTGHGKTTLDKEAFEHPAIFPELLARDHVLSWSNPGDLVLDPFCGSGTTGKMALLNSRRFIGIDISPAYVDLSAGRIRKALNLEQ